MCCWGKRATRPSGAAEGIAPNVPRFTTPREPGDSRAKRCPTPFPSYPFPVPAAASERSERSVNPACYTQVIRVISIRSGWCRSARTIKTPFGATPQRNHDLLFRHCHDLRKGLNGAEQQGAVRCAIVEPECSLDCR